jgi:hypothetical protein
VLGHEAEVDQHPHRHEEHGAEDDLEGQDLAQRLGLKAALGDHEARQEGSEGDAQPRQRTEVGGPEADRHDGQQEDLG